MTALDKIYQEVNRRVNNAHELPDSNPDKEFQLGEDSAYAFVLGLIEELMEQEPQGLDEAAEEFARTTFTQPYSETPEKEITIIEPDKLAGFKAGAKWMAEQGETHEHYVIREVAGHDVGPAIVVYPDNFDIGDRVIVQIRKKEE